MLHFLQSCCQTQLSPLLFLSFILSFIATPNGISGGWSFLINGFHIYSIYDNLKYANSFRCLSVLYFCIFIAFHRDQWEPFPFQTWLIILDFIVSHLITSFLIFFSLFYSSWFPFCIFCHNCKRWNTCSSSTYSPLC